MIFTQNVIGVVVNQIESGSICKGGIVNTSDHDIIIFKVKSIINKINYRLLLKSNNEMEWKDFNNRVKEINKLMDK